MMLEFLQTYSWNVMRVLRIKRRDWDDGPATSLIARFMGPSWGPSGTDRTQVGPMLAPWTLLSRIQLLPEWQFSFHWLILSLLNSRWILLYSKDYSFVVIVYDVDTSGLLLWFAGDTFKCILVKENISMLTWILFQQIIKLKFVQVMAWCRSDMKQPHYSNVQCTLCYLYPNNAY